MVAFDYASVGNRASELRSITAKVTAMARKISNHAFEIGEELYRAKQILGHGNFRPWLQQEFEWSQRTAGQYVSIYRRLGEHQNILRDCSISLLRDLSAKRLLPHLREEAIDMIDVGCSEVEVFEFLESSGFRTQRSTRTCGGCDARALIAQMSTREQREILWWLIGVVGKEV